MTYVDSIPKENHLKIISSIFTQSKSKILIQ